MNLKTSPFSILNKERRQMEYIKGIYKRRVQSEIESYEDFNEKEYIEKIKNQDILML